MTRIDRHLVVATAMFAAVTCGYSAFAEDAAANKNDPVAAKIAAEQPYRAENDAAMIRMMDDMEAKPSGDIDRDFVVMMTPHHQGAIDMAQAYLRYGTNEQLKRIAQEIIVDQQEEIAAIKIAIGDPLPPSDAAPTQVTPQTAPAGAMKAISPNMKM